MSLPDLSALRLQVDGNLTLPQLALYIMRSDNFVFTKMGDGEMACMNGEQGANCDGQTYGPVLQQALHDAYRKLDSLRQTYPRCYVVPWGHPFSILHQVPNQPSQVKLFWRAIMESNRYKVFVGPCRLHEVTSFLRADAFVAVPERDAFSVYSGIRDALNELARKDAVVIFSAGLASKVWIAELASSSLTCVDAGSAFDPIFVGQTRTNQYPPHEARALYGL